MDKQKYFDHCHNIEELRTEYRRLVRLYHPDRGGDTAKMQAINTQYEIALKQIGSDAVNKCRPQSDDSPPKESTQQRNEAEVPQKEGSAKAEPVPAKKKIKGLCIIVAILAIATLAVCALTAGYADVVWIVAIIAVFSLDVICAILKTKYIILDDRSLSSKICTGISFAVCLCGIAYNSFTIKPMFEWGLRGLDEGRFNLANLIGYLVVWLFLTGLLGCILATMQHCALIAVHYKKFRSSGKWASYPGGEAAIFTSINAMGILVAYNLMLFAFGMSDWIVLQILSK